MCGISKMRMRGNSNIMPVEEGMREREKLLGGGMVLWLMREDRGCGFFNYGDLWRFLELVKGFINGSETMMRVEMDWKEVSYAA